MTNWTDRPDGYRYGLGLLQIDAGSGDPGQRRSLIGHKGNSAGFSASAFHDPASGTTVVVLTNAHATDVTPAVEALMRVADEGGGDHRRHDRLAGPPDPPRCSEP